MRRGLSSFRRGRSRQDRTCRGRDPGGAARVRDVAVPEGEMALSKAYLAGRLELRMEETRHVASGWAAKSAARSSPDPRGGLAELDAVTSEGVQRLAGGWCARTPSVWRSLRHPGGAAVSNRCCGSREARMKAKQAAPQAGGRDGRGPAEPQRSGRRSARDAAAARVPESRRNPGPILHRRAGCRRPAGRRASAEGEPPPSRRRPLPESGAAEPSEAISPTSPQGDGVPACRIGASRGRLALMRLARST